jgi:hypothetical protein
MLRFMLRGRECKRRSGTMIACTRALQPSPRLRLGCALYAKNAPYTSVILPAVHVPPHKEPWSAHQSRTFVTLRLAPPGELVAVPIRCRLYLNQQRHDGLSGSLTCFGRLRALRTSPKTTGPLTTWASPTDQEYSHGDHPAHKDNDVCDSR